MTSDSNRASLTRRTLLDYARRHQRAGSGSMPWQKGTTFVLEWPNLVELLVGVPWAVVGAVATRNYMPERATADLDIAILPADSGRAAERLRDAGYEKIGDLAIGGSTWRSPQGLGVDVIEGREVWWPAALRAAQAIRVGDSTPVLSLPYLVLMKLIAGRVQDTADVTRMLGYASDEELGNVRTVVTGNNPDLADDLEGFIALGKLETQQ